MTSLSRIGWPGLAAAALLLAGCGSTPPAPPVHDSGIPAGMMDHLFATTDMACVRRRIIDRALPDGWTVASQNPQALVLDRPTTLSSMSPQGPLPLVERMVLAFVPAEGGTRMHYGAGLMTVGGDGREQRVAPNAVSEGQVKLFQTALQSESECALSRMRPLR